MQPLSNTGQSDADHEPARLIGKQPQSTQSLFDSMQPLGHDLQPRGVEDSSLQAGHQVYGQDAPSQTALGLRERLSRVLGEARAGNLVGHEAHEDMQPQRVRGLPDDMQPQSMHLFLGKGKEGKGKGGKGQGGKGDGGKGKGKLANLCSPGDQQVNPASPTETSHPLHRMQRQHSSHPHTLTPFPARQSLQEALVLALHQARDNSPQGPHSQQELLPPRCASPHHSPHLTCGDASMHPSLTQGVGR